MEGQVSGAQGGEPPPAPAPVANSEAFIAPPPRKRVGRPIGTGGHRQRREAQTAAAAEAGLDVELLQLREMQAMELELKRLQELQAFHRRRLGLADNQALSGGGAGELDHTAASAPGTSSLGARASSVNGALNDVGAHTGPGWSKGDAAGGFLGRAASTQSLGTHAPSLPLPPALGSLPPPNAASQVRTNVLQGQENIPAVSTANREGTSLSLALAVKVVTYPNPRRLPTRNSGFPLPRLNTSTSTSNNAYVSSTIKSLDGFRSAYQQMKKNMDEGMKKRKTSVVLGELKNDATGVRNDDAKASPLRETFLVGDIFAGMICRRRIDLKEHDLTVTGMYSVNDPDRIIEDVRQRQRQMEQKRGRQLAASTPSVLAPVPSPVAAVHQPSSEAPPQKKQRIQRDEHLQMIAELRKQKAMLDEQYELLKAAKEREEAANTPLPAAQPIPAQGASLAPQAPMTAAQGLHPPILPNLAGGLKNGDPSQPQPHSIQLKLEEIARLEQEKALLHSQFALGKRAVVPSAQAHQKPANGLPNTVRTGPPGQPVVDAAEEGAKRAPAASPPPEEEASVANTALGAASSQGLVPHQPQATDVQQHGSKQAFASV